MSRKSVSKRYRSSRLTGHVTCDDAMLFLGRMESGTADIIFLDPPFNLSKQYGKVGDARPEDEYGLWLYIIIAEAIRVLAPGGALYLYHLPSWAVRVTGLLNNHLEFRHWIAVSMKNGFARGERLYPAHYALLYYTKGAPTQFNRPRLQPALCRKCGETIRDYGGYRQIILDKGVNLSDVWDDLSPVRHAGTKKRKANELPSILTDRVLAMSGVAEGIFVDPFAGAGTAVVSAAKAGMIFFACDIERTNAALIIERLNALDHELSRSHRHDDPS